ncbi:MAG TPA: maleylpyruvate isomerase N-terminal domain-containing protein [Acidimicrobiales bacterium]|nr:maleylpyruvate isomerase N-terminal domain-containing protein [Acidimicrobiales bacterium]
MADTHYESRVDALAGAWRVWAELGGTLSPEEWRAPSRCPGWRVADLYAHHSAFPVALAGSPPPAPEEAPAGLLSAVDILRGFNRPGGPAHEMAGAVADMAAEEAARTGQAELLKRFSVTAPSAIAALRGADPGMLIGWPATGGRVSLVEALRIILTEATVHLLDVQRALSREPYIPAEALRETAVLLAEVADPVDFVEAATGRSAKPVLPVLR